jgi:hypothetical protein
MRGLQVEIIPGTVKVRRHGRNEVCAMLPCIGLAELDSGDFRDRVRFVRWLKSPGQKRLFLDRLDRKPRVMHELPRNRSFFTPKSKLAEMRLFWICKFSRILEKQKSLQMSQVFSCVCRLVIRWFCFSRILRKGRSVFFRGDELVLVHRFQFCNSRIVSTLASCGRLPATVPDLANRPRQLVFLTPTDSQLNDFLNEFTKSPALSPPLCSASTRIWTCTPKRKSWCAWPTHSSWRARPLIYPNCSFNCASSNSMTSN